MGINLFIDKHFPSLKDWKDWLSYHFSDFPVSYITRTIIKSAVLFKLKKSLWIEMVSRIMN